MSLQTKESGSRAVKAGNGRWATQHVAPRENAFTRSRDNLLRIVAYHPVMAGGTAGQNPGEALLSPNVLDFQNHIEFAQTAEEIGIEYLFMAEGYDPGSSLMRAASVFNPWLYNPMIAAMLIPVTTRIGIITTMHFPYLAPVVIARMGANLDAMSGGRWGINMVTGPSNAPGLVPEPGRSLSHDERYEYATEAMDAILSLWRGERLEHNGKYFKLEGQLIDPLPVQRPPGIVSAGNSGPGRNFAAKYADYLFTTGGTAEQHDLEHEGLDDLLRSHGREPGALKYQVRATTYIRDTQAEVDEFVERMEGYFDAEVQASISLKFGGESRGRMREIEQSLTEVSPEARRRSAVGMDFNLQGTPQHVADKIIKFHKEGRLQGVALVFQDWHPSELRQFGDKVMPLLKEEGIWVHPRDRGYSW
jgi:FMNH2-dependent dimethyl sulfone monooxygenase